MTKILNGVDVTKYVEIVDTSITVDNNLTGIITVTTAGAAVSGGDVSNTADFYIKPHPDNTDTIWVMPDGRTKANGFPLNTSETACVRVSNLNLLDFDADVSGEKICWMKA